MAAINITRVQLTDTFNTQRVQLNLALDAIQEITQIVDPTEGTLTLNGDVQLGDNLNDNVLIAGTLTVNGDIIDEGTGRIKLPVGTTAQRPGVPEIGDIRYNNTLNQFEGFSNAGWDQIGGGAKGSPGNQVFFENDTNVVGDYTINTGKNAVTAGPVTIDDGVNVTVPDGSAWVIV